MPNYFLDTSALAKLYHAESGSDHLDRIVDEAGSQVFISHLSIVELESVLAIKTRTGEIDQQAREGARRRFSADLRRRQLMVLPFVQASFQDAKKLLIRYGVTDGLRTLDALQLAVALDLFRARRIDVLVAADQRLCRVALKAGCPAVNPEKPG